MPAPAVPLGVYPKVTQLLQVGKEATFGTAPAQAAFMSVPIVDFKPDNKIQWQMDGSQWGDFTSTHDVQAGPQWAESEIAESPVYPDSIGPMLYGLMGDYVTTGTASTPTWVASSAISAGAGPIAVTSGSSAVSGTFIQIDTGVNAEIVT